MCNVATHFIYQPPWPRLAGRSLTEPTRSINGSKPSVTIRRATRVPHPPTRHTTLLPGVGRQYGMKPAHEKNTLGYWTSVHDSASWQVGFRKPGLYRVSVLQGCGAGSGGSVVSIELAGQSLEFTVEETGGFQNFVWRRNWCFSKSQGPTGWGQNDPGQTRRTRCPAQNQAWNGCHGPSPDTLDADRRLMSWANSTIDGDSYCQCLSGRDCPTYSVLAHDPD